MTELDRRAAGDAARAMIGHLSSAMLVILLELGRRTGLLEALRDGPRTLAELAEVAGVVPRYAREWLGAMVTGGVVVHDPATDTFRLPPEQAAVLLDPTPYNLSGMISVATGTAQALDQLAVAFREGGGIRYADHPLDVDEVMDRMSRHRYDALLVDVHLAQVPGLVDRLDHGARVLEVGCGQGHAARLLARRFPASRVTGLDVSEDAVAAARDHADVEGLDNVEFVVGSAIAPPAGPWDVVCAFDVVHDLADPRGVLAALRGVIAPDGIFLMVDSGAPPTLAQQAALPWAPLMYGVSIGHCLTVSLAQQGEGLGAMWGREAALAALADAGFDQVDTHDLKGDPMDLLYVARPGS